MSRIDLDAKAGKTRGQFDRDGRQLVLVLRDILAIDHQQRLLAGVRVGTQGIARFETRWRGRQATGIGRNGAIGVAGFFGTDGSEVAAQLAGVCGGYRGLDQTGERQRDGGG
ncbi:hypothetical protein D3C76_832030 [compost metagenome]